MRPMKTGMVESSSATTKPAANNATNRPFAWRAKCQKKAMKPGGGSGLVRQIGRLQQPLEQRKHGTGSKRSATALRRHALAPSNGATPQFLFIGSECGG